MESDGRKDDGGKLKWHLLPLGPVAEIVRVLTIATTDAKKPAPYSDHNWKFVSNARDRYYSALMRHVSAWWMGEKYDPEFGIHHLAHAGCCLLFLLWFDQQQEASDDAP